jgi:hypothetical protein
VTRIASFLAGLALVAGMSGAAGAQERQGRQSQARPPAPRGERAGPWRGPPGGGRGTPYYGAPGGYGRYGPPPMGYGRPPSPNSLGADWREQQDEARRGVRQGQMVPLGRVIENIRRRTPGRQLDAGLEYQDGRQVYRLRWLTPSGRRVDYLIDAATGQVVR